jgi:hypothetical protein
MTATLSACRLLASQYLNYRRNRLHLQLLYLGIYEHMALILRAPRIVSETTQPISASSEGQ